MDKSLFNVEALEHIQQIAEIKGTTEQEAIAAVINNYSSKYVRLIESASRSAGRAINNCDE